MITWLGQVPLLPALPPRPADWPADVPFPPSPAPDGSAPFGWPSSRPWPPPKPAGWPDLIAWPNPTPPPAPPGWQGPWPLSPPCWADTGLLWPPPAPAFWWQTGLPWPPLPGVQLPSWALVPWWPAECPMGIPQPSAAPPTPTVRPPTVPLTSPPPAPTAPPAPAPAPSAAKPATLAQAIEDHPITAIFLALALVRTIAAVAKARK
jgi:hypothetical protein